MVDDFVNTATLDVFDNAGNEKNRAVEGSLFLHDLLPTSALTGLRKMWKPPWATATPSFRLNRRRQLIIPSMPGFKNNAVFILIYFGLIFTFLLSSVNCTVSARPPKGSELEPPSVELSWSGDGPDVMDELPSFDFAEEEQLDATAESESRLHRQLMENYAKDARPSKISNVSVHLQLISLDDVQESGNLILTVQIWMTWRDLRFRWSPSNYSGVVNLQILPVDRIWFPLFWIRNSAQPDIQNSFWSHFPAFIGWTGIVSWVSSGKVTVACDLDFFYYPSDSQTCSIQFAAHDSYHVNLTSRDIHRPVCFDRYTNNSLWEISGVRAVPKGMTIHRTTEFLSFDLRLRRRPLTDVLRIFLPTACLAIVSLIAFLLPPDSGDKLNVTFTTMLAFFVMFLAITDMVPFTAEHTPIMTYFVVSTLLLSTIETILCAVIMTIADTEKAHEVMAATAACEEASRQSSMLLQHVQNMTKSSERRQSASLGCAVPEVAEPGQPGESDTFLGASDVRPRSFSSSTSCSTESGVIDLSGTDAALITAARGRSKKHFRDRFSISSSQSDVSLLRSNSVHRRVGVFFIRLFQRAAAMCRRYSDSGDRSCDEGDVKLVSRGLVSAKLLNLFSFFIFGAVKILLISLVSVILYDQSRQEDVESVGFHRPEYSNCWQ